MGARDWFPQSPISNPQSPIPSPILNFMPSELTLFFTDEDGQEQQAVVNANPFTIGRQDGNELVIKDTGLSRRHALITSFNDVAQISDCGSQNGTYLNGQRLNSAAVLKNGDLITIGQTCKIRVQLVVKTAPSKPVIAAPITSAQPVPTSHPAPQNLPAAAQPSLELPKLSPALIATIATLAIVLGAGALIGLVAWKKAKAPVTDPPIVFVDPSAAPTTTDSPTATDSPTTSQPGVPAASDQFEKSLVQVIRNISNDQSYPFPPAALAEIKRKAEQFATPTLAATLRTIATRGDETITNIKAQGLKKPALPIFLALAETNGGQAGDPLAMARQLVPEIQFLRGHFGSEFADPTLMLVAAHKIPGGSKKSHPLLEPLRRLVKNPQTDRNVWFLREKGALSDVAYDFVLRFLAYAAIAQNPRQFGLDAPALVF